MLMQCANPECSSTFAPSSGAMFEFEFDPKTNIILPPRVPKRVGVPKQIYWLCQACARRMTLEARDGGVETVGFSRAKRAS